MTLTFNPTVYIELLAQTMPSAILVPRGSANETEAEYQRLLAITESLHFKKDRTLEEKDRKSTRLNSSHHRLSRMPSSA